jgi:hypothetical protein
MFTEELASRVHYSLPPPNKAWAIYTQNNYTEHLFSRLMQDQTPKAEGYVAGAKNIRTTHACCAALSTRVYPTGLCHNRSGA